MAKEQPNQMIKYAHLAMVTFWYFYTMTTLYFGTVWLLPIGIALIIHHLRHIENWSDV